MADFEINYANTNGEHNIDYKVWPIVTNVSGHIHIWFGRKDETLVNEAHLATTDSKIAPSWT
jgi:hypothetical protein